MKFTAAEALGFVCGPYNAITVVDMDDTDLAIISEGERLFGLSPLHWQTGGGKFAMAFRYNGEARRIRPIASLPIDLLGDGVVIAPPSVGERRQYEIIKGSLSDLERLPAARIPTEIQLPNRYKTIVEGQRNQRLFNYCQSVVGRCDDLNQLVDAAQTWAERCFVSQLPPAEIEKTCRSVWQYQGGRKRVMSHIVDHPKYAALVSNPNDLALFSYLSAENSGRNDFMITDSLSKARGWPRRLVPTSRANLLELGLIERVGRKGNTGPYLYRWRVEPA